MLYFAKEESYCQKDVKLEKEPKLYCWAMLKYI